MMRRSFGGGRGGMSGGGSMFRAVRRTVRAGGEPFSHSSTTTTNTTTTASSPTNHKPSNLNILSLSSANNTNPFSLPIYSTSGWPSSSPTDEFDQWEFIEDERATPLDYDDHFVFGCVPSLDEVQHAVSSLQQVLDPASFSQFIKDRVAYDSGNDAAEEVTSPTSFIHRRVPSVRSEVDWMEPPLQLYNSRMLNLHGSDRVYDAFHLLQTDPSVQRMVVALSSDKAVWDAVMNNEVVRELRESLDEAGNFDAMSSVSDDGYDDSEGTMDLLTWIFLNAKTKVIVLIDKITNMVHELLFIPPTAGSEKKREQATIEYSFDGKLGTCVLLSVVVFLTVVVTRATRA